MVVWGPHTTGDLAINDIRLIRAKNRQRVTPFESSVDRTMEALEAFAAHAVTPAFQGDYQFHLRDHAVRIVEAIIGINRHV